jgi:hypothetical protein
MPQYNVTDLMSDRIVLASYRMAGVDNYEADIAISQSSGGPAFPGLDRQMMDIFVADARNLCGRPYYDSEMLGQNTGIEWRKG